MTPEEEDALREWYYEQEILMEDENEVKSPIT